VTLPGYAPVSKVVEVAAMESATVAIELQSLTSAPAPAPAADGSINLSPRLPPATTATTSALVATAHAPAPRFPWVVAGLLAAAAGASGGLALWSSADLKKQRDQWGSQKADLHQRSTRVKQLALLTDVLIGSAVVAAGAATYLTVSRSDEGAQQVAFVHRF
jgi:hypothetical protein